MNINIWDQTRMEENTQKKLLQCFLKKYKLMNGITQYMQR